MHQTPIQFASRWRLDHEKGRDDLLPALRTLCTAPDTPPFVVHIYGDGQYADEVKSLARDFPHAIFYHGRQPLEHINHTLTTTHYALMPSLFLETFGLTALESLTQGVPVIGYHKGGLEAFVMEDLDITQYQDLTDCLHTIIHQHNHHHRQKLHQQAHAIASDYTANHFIEQITTETGGTLPQTILLVSDYTNLLGGIETYLHKVQKLLQTKGSTVIIIGGSREKNATRNTYLQMVGTARNPLLRKKIQTAIHEHRPDLVRYHSVLRNIGHAGIIHNPHGPSRVTYHDLGLMHPFPSAVYATNQITPWLRWRLSQAPRHQRPLVILKYLSTLLIRKKLARHCDLHTTPSPFMTSMITRASPEKVKSLGHFTNTN